MSRPKRLVSYAHRDSKDGTPRYVQFADNPLPAWAVDITPQDDEPGQDGPPGFEWPIVPGPNGPPGEGRESD